MSPKVWESAPPPTHIWKISPPKKFFFVGTFPNPFLHILLSSSLSSLQTYPCQHAWKPADQVPILQSQRERGWNCEHILSSLIIFSYFLSDAKHEIPLNNNHLFCLLLIIDCRLQSPVLPITVSKVCSGHGQLWTRDARSCAWEIFLSMQWVEWVTS